MLVNDLLKLRGVDMLISDLDADLPRKPAAVIEAIDCRALGKITALHARQRKRPAALKR